MDPVQKLPVVKMIDIVPLESADAEGVIHAIEKGLAAVSLSYDSLKVEDANNPHLLLVNFDGASVNFGTKSDVVKRIQDTVSEHVIAIHYIAHKFEHSVLDANKSCSYMSKFENTVKGIFNFYHFSPRRRRQIKEIADIFECELAHFRCYTGQMVKQ